MSPAATTCILIFGLSASLVAAAWWLTLRLTPEQKRVRLAHWLANWSAKGLLAPLLLWALMNLGLSWNLQPFMPSVQAAQNSGRGWAQEYFYVVAIGGFVVASYWASLTLGWILASAAGSLEEEPRKQFKGLCLTCLLGLGIPAALLILIGGWDLLGAAGSLVVLPLAAYAPGVLNPAKLPPMYARAIARMKFGKYSEAEWEIIHELEKREDDFEGWMMLAELYANHFQDLAEAQRTVLEICEQPQVTPSQLAIALHRLADWQLKLGGDPSAARHSLQLICERLPGSHLAHMARLRLNHLPRTEGELRNQQRGQPIPLPALGEHFEDAPAARQFQNRKEAAHAANACVDELKEDPNNAAAREKLARIFAEELERADLGTEQIELLLGMSGQSDIKRAEWLALLSLWNLRYCQNPQVARGYLERLVREYPETPQAFAARRRLEQMNTAAR